MLLVDSSIWIDQIQGRATDGAHFVASRDDVDEICITGVIYQEVLQGARTDRDCDRYRDMLGAFLILHPRELSTYEVAAQLYRRARAAGFTIRSANDCLIAAIALEHGALLVHNDRDFLALAQVEPSLLIFPGRAH